MFPTHYTLHYLAKGPKSTFYLITNIMKIVLIDQPRRVLESEQAPSPGPFVDDTTNYRSFWDFDTNTFIFISALICAVLCALGLYSILHRRCGQWFFIQTPHGTSSNNSRLATTTGLKKDALRQIPVTVYSSGDGVNVSATECPICLGEFEDRETVRVLPKCNHGFHRRCIAKWLASHTSCPNCRHSLLELQVNEDQIQSRDDIV